MVDEQLAAQELVGSTEQLRGIIIKTQEGCDEEWEKNELHDGKLNMVRANKSRILK